VNHSINANIHLESLTSQQAFERVLDSMSPAEQEAFLLKLTAAAYRLLNELVREQHESGAASAVR
jgi:hypothetical protein